MKILLNRNRNRAGLIWVVICLLCVLIGGFMVWKILDMLKTLFPPTDKDGNPITNNVTQVHYPDWYYTNHPSALVSKGLTLLSSEVALAPNNATGGNSFIVQYGISIEMLPWMSPKSNYVQSVDGDVNYIQNDRTNLESTIVTGGWTQHTYNRANTNDTSFDWTKSLPPNIVVLQCTTNFIDWWDIYTNDLCGVNTVETHVHGNAPPGSAFYRAVIIDPSQSSH